MGESTYCKDLTYFLLETDSALVHQIKQNKTGGLCFAWMRGDSAVPSPLREVPREASVAGPPRGCRLCVHSPVGSPSSGNGVPSAQAADWLVVHLSTEKTDNLQHWVVSYSADFLRT